MSEQSTDPLQELETALLARRPEAGGRLDARAIARLAEVSADPDGRAWMEAAGLMAADSCGYPVAGGYFDTRSDVSADPRAVAHPEIVDAVMAGLVQQWADDYVLTGRARLDRPWQPLVEAAGP